MTDYRQSRPEDLAVTQDYSKIPSADSRQSNDFPLGSVIMSLPVAAAVFDSNLKILQVSPAFAGLIKPDVFLDKSLADGTIEWGLKRTEWAEKLKSALLSPLMLKVSYKDRPKNVKTRHLRISCSAVSEKSLKEPVGIILVEDITENIEMQKQLASAEKLATVGRLVSKVAHELNNPLDGILRYINLTLRIIEQNNLEKTKEYLQQCKQGLMRMVHIVGELLEFSRSSYPSTEHIRIDNLIEDAIKAMALKADASSVRILRDYNAASAQIRNGGLFQVFCNLIKNAIEAMPDGGELKISTRMSPQNTIVAEFRDNGTSFPPEDAEAIFEPFFTTKETGKGTGLGLTICRDIVKSYNGWITAENAAEGGSVFTVYLPLSGETAQ